MNAILISKPWVASLYLSIFSLFTLLLFSQIPIYQSWHSLAIILMSYGLFFVFATHNLGKYKAVRRVCWQRIRYKGYAMCLQIILSLLFSVICSYFLADSGVIGQYVSFLNIFFLCLPLLLLVPLYLVIVDQRMENADDDYAKFGQWLVSQNKSTTWHPHKLFLLKTAVKTVFVPFMVGGLSGNIAILMNFEFNNSYAAITLLLFNVVITIDMLVGTFGYLCSSALINNQIKDTDTNIMGWIFCLLCYPPLVWLMRQVNQQADGMIWTDFMQPDMLMYWVFFILINGLWIAYLSSSFSFGMSFSNLSWRYLIDSGPFRYTKHPAYIAKNIYWWLHTLPFLGTAWFSAQWWQNMLGMTFVSLVYYGRAKSEERHLSKFPEYRDYMQRIEREGIFRWVRHSPIKYRCMDEHK